MSQNSLYTFVKAKTQSFGNFIDLERALVDFPTLSLVEVDLPEYERNGLGRALLKVVRYKFEDINQYGVEGMSICADSSRGHIVYADMNPVQVGLTHSEVQDKAPKEFLQKLYAEKLPIEMITLAVLRYEQFNGDFEKIMDFLAMYHARSSWMESHAVEVRFANIEALTGDDVPFDWDRLLISDN